MTPYRTRIRKLINAMLPDSITVVISAAAVNRNSNTEYRYRNQSDMLYLTGINEPDTAITIDSGGEINVFMPEHDPEKERWVGISLPAEKVMQDLGIKAEHIHPHKTLFGRLPRLLKNHGIIYYNFGPEPLVDQKIMQLVFQTIEKSRQKEYGPTQIIHTRDLLGEMRVIKDESELNLLRKAGRINAMAHNNLMRETRKRVSDGEDLYEYHLKGFLQQYYLSHGLAEEAYPAIVAAAENATYLHYQKEQRKINPDDLILVDAGCELQGYASDITRTFKARGNFLPAQKAVYELTLLAQKKAIELAVTDNTLETLHNAVIETFVEGLWAMGFLKKIPEFIDNGIRWVFPTREEVIEKKNYRLFFMHNTSHFLGLDVHDSGRYYLKNEPRRLKPGMVFTIEPGLYFSADYDFLPEEFRGIGVRIEDDVIVTSDEPEVITEKAIKEISDIESL